MKIGWGFLLSHHAPEDHGRCIRLFGLPMCSRCLGLYPTLLVGTALLLLARGGWASFEGEGSLLLLLTLPALLDWAHGLFFFRPEGRKRRLLTGILLGAALSRVLVLHLRDPFSPPVMDVLGVLAAGATLALALRFRLGPPEA